MDNSVKIQDFLNELNRRHDASGLESKVYFVEGTDRKEYVLKSYAFSLPLPARFYSESSFFDKLGKLKKATDKLISQGAKLARIYDFGIVEEPNGDKKFLEVEDKMPGSPIYILRESSMGKDGTDYLEKADKVSPKRKLEMFSEIRKKMQEHNVKQQEIMLDASPSSFSNLVENFNKIYTQPSCVTLDGFAENFLFDPKSEEFSIVDVNSNGTEGNPLGAERVVVDVIHSLILSKERIANMGPDLCLRIKMTKNNAYMQDKIIKALGKAGLLIVRSERMKEQLMLAVEQNIDDINKFAKRVKIKTK